MDRKLHTALVIGGLTSCAERKFVAGACNHLNLRFLRAAA